MDDDDDTAGYHPKVAVGYRLPHCTVERFDHRSKEIIATNVTTITDIESQCQKRWIQPLPPRFSLILLCPYNSKSMRSVVHLWAECECKMPMKTFELYSNRPCAMERCLELSEEKCEPEILLDTRRQLQSLVEVGEGPLERLKTFYGLIVRSDGHIVSFKSFIDNGGLFS